MCVLLSLNRLPSKAKELLTVLNSELSLWLPTKASEPSLPCYLIHNWKEKSICAIVNVICDPPTTTLHAGYSYITLRIRDVFLFAEE